MTTNTNIHGLSRYIPVDVKREVRRRSKHGCVFCRAMIYQYEHIEPVFADAAAHEPDAICLLCPSCHAEVTAGRISKQEVLEAYREVQQSNTVRPPHYQMRISGQMRLGLGTSTFDFLTDGFSILEYDGQSVLGIRYEDDHDRQGIFPLLSGNICDPSGATVLEIVDNEITLVAPEIDVRAEGAMIHMSDASSNFELRFTFIPPGGLRIDRMLMRFKDIEIDTRDEFGVTCPTLNQRRASCLLGQFSASGCVAAVSYKSDRSGWLPQAPSMIGGVGINLPFMGLTVAKGAGAMALPKIELEWVR